MRPLFDFCIFHNEFDILDLRLAYMMEFVDNFYVCESNITHQGQPKKYQSGGFLEFSSVGRRLLKERRLTFIHLDMNDIRENHLKDGTSDHFRQWGAIEGIHRKRFSDWVISKIQVEYIGILADCDEVVSDLLCDFADDLKDLTSVDMLMFYFAADNLSYLQQWSTYVKIFRPSDLRNSDFQTLRFHTDPNHVLTNMGWHFSSFGGIRQVQDKISSFGHPEFNTEENKSFEIMAKRLRNNEDYLGRCEFPCRKFELSGFPERLQALLLERPRLLDKSNAENLE